LLRLGYGGGASSEKQRLEKGAVTKGGRKYYLNIGVILVSIFRREASGMSSEKKKEETKTNSVRVRKSRKGSREPPRSKIKLVPQQEKPGQPPAEGLSQRRKGRHQEVKVDQESEEITNNEKKEGQKVSLRDSWPKNREGRSPRNKNIL